MEHELKGNSDDLGRGVGLVSYGGIVNRVFELIDQCFERLIAVVRSMDSIFVVLECGGGNVSVCRIKMVQ